MDEQSAISQLPPPTVSAAVEPESETGAAPGSKPPLVPAEAHAAAGGIHVRPLYLGVSVAGLIGGLLGVFQLGHMVGQASLDEKVTLAEQRIMTNNQTENETRQQLRSDLQIQKEQFATIERELRSEIADLQAESVDLERRNTDLRTNLSASREQSVELQASVATYKSQHTELERQHRDALAEIRRLSGISANPRPFARFFSDNLSAEKIDTKVRNDSAKPFRITRLMSQSWLDGQPGRLLDVSRSLIVQPNEIANTNIASTLTPQSAAYVVEGVSDWRIAVCVEYLAVSELDSRRWYSELWFVYNPKSNETSILKEADAEARSPDSGCNVLASMPEDWDTSGRARRQRAVEAAVQEGDSADESGDFVDALKQYQRAVELGTIEAVPGASWNSVCWNGALSGRAAEVMYACEQAVERSSADEQANRIDSRGIARAIAGDVEGAIVDLELVVQAWEESEDEYLRSILPRRLEILAQLRRGRDPMTRSMLGDLRDE